jgi:hypothetical protein
VSGSLGDLNAANRYTYANDDPVNLVDPSGADSWYNIFGSCLASAILAPILWVGAVLGGVGALIITIIAAAGFAVPLWAISIVAGALGILVGLGIACAIVDTEHAT